MINKILKLGYDLEEVHNNKFSFDKKEERHTTLDYPFFFIFNPKTNWFDNYQLFRGPITSISDIKMLETINYNIYSNKREMVSLSSLILNKLSDELKFKFKVYLNSVEYFYNTEYLDFVKLLQKETNVTNEFYKKYFPKTEIVISKDSNYIKIRHYDFKFDGYLLTLEEIDLIIKLFKHYDKIRISDRN